jgi:glycosyltransferase involved in cell wall biosynthesis
MTHRNHYDVVHTGSFPFFSVLAAAAALKGTRTALGVEWYEVWSKAYWHRYLGSVRGSVGWIVQRLSARVPQHAFVLSDLHGRRLREEGLRGVLTKLAGLYTSSVPPAADALSQRAPLVVFAGRHIPEKRVTAIPPAIAAARRRVPNLRALILGDGPESESLRIAIERAGVSDIIDAPGFVDAGAVQSALARASCMLLPSEREGYGLIVLEAAALGTPSIVVTAEDNAAVELVRHGENGFVAASTAPDVLADAIVAVHQRGSTLRKSTADWFAQNAHRLSVAESLRSVVEIYSRRASP